MAAVAVVSAAVNGLVAAADSRPASPLSANSSSAKRKRDTSDDGCAEMDGLESAAPTPTSPTEVAPDRQALIRDYFVVMAR